MASQQKMGRLFVAAALVSGCGGALADNSQKVDVQGAVVNRATQGGHAVMNLGSTQGAAVKGRNRQSVDVQGAILNSADAGARSELNIATKRRPGASGSQVISVTGPVVTSARGRGVNSSVNIGDR